MEKAILNIDILNVSQGMNNSFSHKGDKAIDITSLTYLKAPFTGTIKKIYNYANTVWIESNNKVEYSDGTKDYMTIMTMHSNDISNLYVGKIIKQGEIYYHPGTSGNATGSHIHIAVGKGKFTGSGWYENNYHNWCINNQYDINKALYLDNNVIIYNAWYEWKKINTNKKTINEIALEVIKGLWNNGSIRKEKLEKAGYNYNTIQNKVNELLKYDYTIHTVVRGEYLIKIAKTYNKDWKKIASDNNIKFPYIIHPNQKLKIYK